MVVIYYSFFYESSTFYVILYRIAYNIILIFQMSSLSLNTLKSFPKLHS